MIPLRLELTNFLSYRETAVLDFQGIHLACISGRNGAGKSSILDAITWALFGKSRSKSDDDLVHRLAILEQGTAEVIFTFDLEGSIYRIIRRKRHGKGLLVEFQIEGAAEQWKTLSESKIRETQAAIESLLHMNYDTFTNASFLLQGQADEFTTKTPNRRKEILADLLGVSQWDRYKEAAAAQRKEVEGQQQLLEGQLTEIESELGEEESRQAVLQAAQAELTAVSERRAVRETLLQQMRQTETAIKQQQQMTQNLAHNLARARHTLQELQQTRQKRQAERDSFQEILAATETIAADFAAWQEAQATFQTWQDKGEVFNRYQQAKRPFELNFNQERGRLQQQQRELTERQQQVAAATAERETVSGQQVAAQAEHITLEEELAALTAQEQAVHKARTELQRLQGERALRQQQLDQLLARQQQIKRWQQEQTAVADNAQTAAKRLAELTEQVTVLATQRERYATALADKNNLEGEQPRLRKQMDRHKERMDQLVAETGGTCPLCGQPLTDEHRAAVVADLQTEGSEMGDRYRHNREQLAALGIEVSELEKIMQRAPQLEKDQQVQQQRLAQAEARLVEIEGALTAWNEKELPQLAALKAQQADTSAMTAQQAAMDAAQAAVAGKSRLERKRREVQNKLAQAAARLAEIERQVTEWESAGKAALAEVTEQLQTEAFAAEARAELARLEADIAALAYDAGQHQAARQKRDALAAAPQRHQQLQQAEAAVQPLQQSLVDLQQRLQDQEQTVAELAAQHETAVSDLEALVGSSGDLRAVEDEVFQLREDESIKQRTVGAAQQRLAVLEDQRRRHDELTERKVGVAQQIQRLRLLEKACGRDGVQALLIEQALPDIEERANDLLERLTGGEMRVSFDTQRQLKSRKATVETLDIHIIDGVGERPYENFSGGEQFRVNFAIRLALSQVLAKRAGARLQTLVIDEGFGSQDPQGRQRLVEAINTIQGDFACILIITHIDELRDVFPTRIEVTKALLGSTIAIV